MCITTYCIAGILEILLCALLPSPELTPNPPYLSPLSLLPLPRFSPHSLPPPTPSAVLVSFLTTEILALENCTVHLEAPIHTFSDVISVLWYQNQVLLEPESDRRYSSQFNNSMATLTIFNFGGDQAGQYEVVVNTSDGTSGNAAVDVTFPGEQVMR